MTLVIALSLSAVFAYAAFYVMSATMRSFMVLAKKSPLAAGFSVLSTFVMIPIVIMGFTYTAQHWVPWAFTYPAVFMIAVAMATCVGTVHGLIIGANSLK